MFRKFTLLFILTGSSVLFGKITNAAIIDNYGGSTNYTLGVNDSLTIVSGLYTGNILAFPTGAKITVTDAATFQPNSFPSAGGKMYIYGTAIFNMAVSPGNNFTLNNYGVVSFNSTVDLNITGSNQVWTNYSGALINFAGDVTIRSNNKLDNYGFITCGGDFVMRGTAPVTNYKSMIVTGNFQVNGGSLENRGKINITGLFDINNGTAVISNYCGIATLGGINNSSINFFNYSYLWARNDNGLGNITNTGIIHMVNWSYDNPTQAMVHGKNYTQTGGGAITGKGWMYFYGTTSQIGGTTGTAGVTTDTLKMNDITRVNTTIFYDAQGGTVYPNAIYNAWGVPDSLRVYFVGCSLEINLEIPLAINWNFFEVNLSNNIPVLYWSAEFTQGTVFEIQRSYDGRNFSGINVLSYEVSQSAYEYEDRMVNTHAPIVYYRIKSIEISGVEKYTQTRIVKFSNKPGSVYAAPNPFTNNFIISYKAAEKETITIRMFNVSGQQMLVKNVTVDDGNHNINITEAAELAKGIYVVQVTRGYNIISSSKIIKQ